MPADVLYWFLIFIEFNFNSVFRTINLNKMDCIYFEIFINSYRGIVKIHLNFEYYTSLSISAKSFLTFVNISKYISTLGGFIVWMAFELISIWWTFMNIVIVFRLAVLSFGREQANSMYNERDKNRIAVIFSGHGWTSGHPCTHHPEVVGSCSHPSSTLTKIKRTPRYQALCI